MENFVNQKKLIMQWIAAIVIPLLIWLIPVNDSFTPQIRMYLVATVCAIVVMVFNLLPNMLLAILLPAVYAATNLAPIATAFNAYSGSFFWMVIGALFLGSVMNETGILTRISYIIIRRLGGSFSGAVWAVFASTLIVSIVTFGMGWIVAIPVVLGVIKALHLEKGREAGLICFAGILGAIDCGVCLYSPTTCGIIDSIVQAYVPEYTTTIFTSILYCFPAPLFCILAIFLILRKYKKDQKKNPGLSSTNMVTKEYFTEQLEAMGPISVDEIKSLIIFVIILAMYIISAFTGWSTTYYFILLPYLAFLPVVGCQEKAMTALKNLNLNGVFFASSCVGIGAVGTAVGFSSWLAGLTILLTSGKSALITCILFMIIIIVGNFAMTPTALLTAFGSSFSEIALLVGTSPIAAVFCLRYITDVIFLPHEISGYLLLFGLGYWPMKDFVKDVGFKSVLLFIGFIVVIYPMWSLLGLL